MEDTYKFSAHLVVEADTALAVGSGEKGFTVDRLIARDALGLPYIPGTALAGVLRHALEPADETGKIRDVFGFQDRHDGRGSRLCFSSAHLVGADGSTVVEGLATIDRNGGFYSYFQKLPVRDHVRINDKGAVDGSGKFDEELVHKGTRFAFTMELTGDASDEPVWVALCQAIHQPLFRIGAGTRKGFGKLKVISFKSKLFNLENRTDLLAYLAHGSSLNEPMPGWTASTPETGTPEGWTNYRLTLEPENFFLFAAGHGDEDVDVKPKTEKYFDWQSGRPELTKKDFLLIPATSVKGALSHRVAFHYNKRARRFPELDPESVIGSLTCPVDLDSVQAPSADARWAIWREKIQQWSLDEALEQSPEWASFTDKLDQIGAAGHQETKHVQEKNPAVRALFGYALDEDGQGARGQVILSDLYRETDTTSEKIFNHVSIDRFTGGARHGMLFQQKVSTTAAFEMNILVQQDALSDPQVEKAFEAALDDLCSGRLPLGGSTGRGHGRFTGSYEKNK